MWQERKPLRSPVRFKRAHWLQKPWCVCAQLFTPPALQNNSMMSLRSNLSALQAETVTMSEVSPNDLKYIYLSACCRPTLTPPIGLKRISDALGCCCHATRSHLAHHFALQLLSLSLLCGPLTDLTTSHGYSHVFLVTGLQSLHICLYFLHFVVWVQF